MEYIEKMLDDCDYYILIIGGRYGSLDDDGVGYTEKDANFVKFLDEVDSEGQEEVESIKMEKENLPDGMEVVVLKIN